MRFKPGDVVVIKSPTSVVRGFLGVFVQYRNGTCRDICLVELLNGRRIQLSDRSLEKSTKRPLSWDAIM